MSTLFFVGLALTLVCSLIVLIRIFKSSVLLGVVCLFFSPATLYALARNWNDPDTDIKWPFFLSFIFSGMMLYGAYNIGASVYEEELMAMTDADIAEISDGDPEMIEMVRSQRDALRAEYQWDPNTGASEGSDPFGQLRATVELDSDTETSFGPLSDEAHLSMNYEAAASGLKYQRGTARFESARVELPLPTHFRFVSIDLLEPQARVRERDLPPGSFGWIVHERMDMAREEAWWIEVRFHADGHLDDLGAELAAALGSAPTVLRNTDEAILKPTWHGNYRAATWLEARPDGRYDAHAAYLVRHGVLQYTVPAVSVEDREVALRACRLMAARSETDRGWTPRDYQAGNDKDAGMTLAQWISAQAAEVAAGRAVESESGAG
ncbi:MAG: hypothetical protein R3F15_14390 [Lysobacterales bacterium]